MSVDQMGNWSVIIEGANTYSPDPNRKAGRTRMERAVYRRRGVMIANDYLVNSGGVIFAAQEHNIPTPPHLQIPTALLGNREAVDAWLAENKAEFAALSEKRLAAGKTHRATAIRRNMTELVDLLAGDTDLLPSQAAEHIALGRLAAKERKRKAQDIMAPIPTLSAQAKLQSAAELIVNSQSNIVAVLSKGGKLGAGKGG